MPRPITDRTGQRIGQLLVVSLHPVRTPQRRARWVCKCDCGNTVVVDSGSLREGFTTSCGCSVAEKARVRATTHGMHNTTEYIIHRGLLQRCYNDNHEAYSEYGARGIKVCARWRGKKGFVNFFADMGPRPTDRHSLDRINNDKGYSPANCRWATHTQQNRNKRNTLLVPYRKRCCTLAEWSEILGIHVATLWSRYGRGDRGARLFRPVARRVK